MKVLTLLIPLVLFLTVRYILERRRLRPLGPSPSRNHSPGRGVIVWSWIRAHIRRDPDPDPDPDPEPTLIEDHDWGSVDHTESRARRQQLGTTRLISSKPVVPPARPRTPKPEPKPLDVWVAHSLANGAAYREVIREGMRTFGVSESTVKRSIKAARKDQQK